MPPIEFITVLGAAGVALWIIWLLIKKVPGLHTHSEVVSLQADKKTLTESNRLLVTANTEANMTLKGILETLQNEDSDEKIIEMLIEVLARLPGKETP